LIQIAEIHSSTFGTTAIENGRAQTNAHLSTHLHIKNNASWIKYMISIYDINGDSEYLNKALILIIYNIKKRISPGIL